MADCIFCAIVAGDAEADVVLDEPGFLAFLDRRPVFKGHLLLVPREHVVTLPDLPASERDGFLAAAQRLATAVVTGREGAGRLPGSAVPPLEDHLGSRWGAGDRQRGVTVGVLRGRGEHQAPGTG